MKTYRNNFRVASLSLLFCLFWWTASCGSVEPAKGTSTPPDVPDTADSSETGSPNVDLPAVQELPVVQELPPVQELPSNEDTSCTPTCDGTTCGDDGCGGLCTCDNNQECVGGACEDPCAPDCSGVECGDDGCGGSCGACANGLSCLDGTCACVPECNGKVCGDDGCGGTCGTCEFGPCKADGKCECAAICGEKECGDSYPLGPNTQVPNAASPDPGNNAYCDGVCGRCGGVSNQGKICFDEGADAYCECAGFSSNLSKGQFCDLYLKDCGQVCGKDCGECNMFSECNDYNECVSNISIGPTPFAPP